MNIPRAQIWPSVSFDTTDDDGMAAAVAWVRSLDAETAPAAPAPQNTPGDALRPPSGREVWPAPKPEQRATGHCTHWTEGGEVCCGCGGIIPDDRWGERSCLPKENTR